MNENETTVEVVTSESVESDTISTVTESPEESSGAESIEGESSANESVESEIIYDDENATIADAKSDILDDLAAMVADKLKESENAENETEETDETEETEMVVDEEDSEDAESVALFGGDSAQVMALSESDNTILANIQTSVGAIEKRLTSFASGSFSSWMRLSMTDLLLLIIIMILLFRWLFDFGKELFS